MIDTTLETFIPERSQVAEEHTWNAPSVFASEAEWTAEFENISERLPELARFQGQLGYSCASVADTLEAFFSVAQSMGKVLVYAGLLHNVDTANQHYAAMFSRAQGLNAHTLATAAFIDPELLTIGEATLRQWMKEEPRLAAYDQYIRNLFRKQAHVRSAEVEEILGNLADPFSGSSTIYSVLTNADFKFAPATTSEGRQIPVTHGTALKLITSTDREARRTTYENYQDLFLAYKNTFANNLATSIKQNVFAARVRHFNSSLEAALFEPNIPQDVFYNLIETFRKNLPTWHRYWKIRRQALGVETLRPYDVVAPITGASPSVTYAQAVNWICEGLAPMGEEYVNIVRKGSLEDRWVDIYPNQGKTAGAFSWGTPGTHPFIVMSYNDNILSFSTLAHELGHSMHSYYAWKHQPMVYTQYTAFVAEVASNFHQAMVRAYLLDHISDPTFQINVIEEAMSNFHRYFFVMPSLARFELEMHQRVERGEGLTAVEMIEFMADLYAEGYGGEVEFDRAREGIDWATFGHLYADYYVFQYATGISAANALAKRILSGTRGAAGDYVNFLKTGNSLYPIDALKLAGVDMTKSQHVEDAFAVLSGMVDRLEHLLEERERSAR